MMMVHENLRTEKNKERRTLQKLLKGIVFAHTHTHTPKTQTHTLLK